MPTRPVKTQFPTFTLPAFGVKPVHVDNVPLFGETDNVTTDVWAVTTWLVASSKTSTGWTVKMDPDAPAVGDVTKRSWLATPVMLKFELVAGESTPLVAVK